MCRMPTLSHAGRVMAKEASGPPTPARLCQAPRHPRSAKESGYEPESTRRTLAKAFLTLAGVQVKHGYNG